LKTAYVAGRTYSTEATFPVVGGPDLTYNGGSYGDAFVAKVNASGTALVCCGYIGGSAWAGDEGYGIAVGGSGNAYVTGYTYSSQATFPVIGGPDLTYNGGYDAFVAKISWIQEDDLLATWDGQGVYYRNSINGDWAPMATPATLITAGDLDGDGVDDLIGIWPAQGGAYVKYAATAGWDKLSSPFPFVSARHIAAGKMRAGTGGSMLSQALFGPLGGYAQGPESLIQYQDRFSEGPEGLHFVYQTEEHLIPQEHESGMMRIPGPGEPGFRCAEEKNLFPLETKKRW